MFINVLQYRVLDLEEIVQDLKSFLVYLDYRMAVCEYRIGKKVQAAKKAT